MTEAGSAPPDPLLLPPELLEHLEHLGVVLFDLGLRKGERYVLGEARFGPFRQNVPVPFSEDVAAVRLNGKDLGVVWAVPWRVEITGAVKPSGNALEIDVVNLWPNRLIGDAKLTPEKRLTRTNVQKFYTGQQPLLESGLLGPVTLRAERKG